MSFDRYLNHGHNCDKEHVHYLKSFLVPIYSQFLPLLLSLELLISLLLPNLPLLESLINVIKSYCRWSFVYGFSFSIML